MVKPQELRDRNFERESLIARLESSQERLLRVLADVPENRSTARSSEDAWSVRDIVEHLVIVENRLVSRVQSAEPSTAAANYELDAQVQERGMDRSQKRSAPEAAHPTGQYASLSQAIAAFKYIRKQTMEYVHSGTQDLRSLRVQGPLGDMDGYQLLMYMALHTERHGLQIDEIKNHPAYRK